MLGDKNATSLCSKNISTLNMLSFLFLVNCKWSSWSGYSSCSKSCGSGGTQSRTRSKTQVEKYGGSCSGSKSHSKSCLVKYCPGKYFFFKYLYQPKEHTDNFKSNLTCILFSVRAKSKKTLPSDTV